ncbi:MAG: hypothetical protein WCK39_07930 [Methanomassiliicoccales archaeon]
MTILIRTPDTNLVIARLKENDGLHGKAVAYLSGIPPRDVRILGEVFLEVCRTLNIKSENGIREILQSAKEYMDQRGSLAK